MSLVVYLSVMSSVLKVGTYFKKIEILISHRMGGQKQSQWI